MYSTPPLPGCSCLHKVKGSNESSSFPLPVFSIQLFAGCASSALFPLSICHTLLLFFFFSILHCVFGLSPIPFSSVCAPCSARICCLCNFCCAHMLALPSPPATPCSTECPFSSLQRFCQRVHEPASNGTILPWPLLPFPCCRLLSSNQGEPVLLPSYSTGRDSPAAAQQLGAAVAQQHREPWTAQPSPIQRLRAHSAATQGSGDQLGHSPLSCQTINQDANP